MLLGKNTEDIRINVSCRAAHLTDEQMEKIQQSVEAGLIGGTLKDKTTNVEIHWLAK
jgi:ribosomal protein S13